MSKNSYVSLLELSKPKEDEVFMRLEDTLLDVEEAEILTTRMYDQIKSTHKLEVPDHTSHQTTLARSPQMNAQRVRAPEETDDEYLKRLHSVNTWPGHSAIIEAKWIWRAQVVIEATGLFHGF
jgi:hypothetical protein